MSLHDMPSIGTATGTRVDSAAKHLMACKVDSRLLQRWLENINVIGLTAGASTPEDVCQSCVERLSSLCDLEVEEVEFLKEEVVFQLPRQLI